MTRDSPGPFKEIFTWPGWGFSSPLSVQHKALNPRKVGSLSQQPLSVALPSPKDVSPCPPDDLPDLETRTPTLAVPDEVRASNVTEKTRRVRKPVSLKNFQGNCQIMQVLLYLPSVCKTTEEVITISSETPSAFFSIN